MKHTRFVWRDLLGVRLIAVLTMVAGFLAVEGRQASVLAEESGIEGNTFTGVHFDWSIEWDEELWMVQTEDNSGVSDYISLDTVGDVDVVLGFLAYPLAGDDVEGCLDDWQDMVAGIDGISEVEVTDELDVPPAPRGGAAIAYIYEQERGAESESVVSYVQCRPLAEEDAVLSAALTADLDDYDDVLPLSVDVLDTIETGGAANVEDETDAASGVDGNTFSGVNFDWSMTWDESDWAVGEEDNSLGTDFVVLELTGDSDAYVSFEAMPSTFTDTLQCALRGLDLVDRQPGVTNIQREEYQDRPPLLRSGASLTYTFDYAKDAGDGATDYAGYIQCVKLGDGDAVLLITLGAEASQYDEAVVVAADVLETIEADGDPIPEVGKADDAADAYVSGIDGDAYESPTYGYTVEWNSEVWGARRAAEIVDGAPNDHDQLALERADGREVLTRLWIHGVATESGDLEACVEAQAEAWMESGAAVETRPLEDEQGDPVTGATPEGGVFAAYESVIVNEQDKELDAVLHFECRSLVEGESALVLTTLTTPERYEDDLDLVEKVTDTIELD